MSSRLQRRKQPSTKGVLEKKKSATLAGGLKKKTKQKGPVKDSDCKENTSDTDDSSLDEKYLEELDEESDDVATTESEDLSQEFSDEEKLMEYYENKLREHSILGNIHLDESICGSSDEEELKCLATEALVTRKMTSKPDLVRIIRSPSTSKRSTTGFGACRKDCKSLKPIEGRRHSIIFEGAKAPAKERNAIKEISRKTPLKGKPLVKGEKLVSSNEKASVYSSVILLDSSSDRGSRQKQRFGDKNLPGAPSTGYKAAVSNLTKTSKHNKVDRLLQTAPGKKSRATPNNGNPKGRETRRVLSIENDGENRKVIDYLNKMREMGQSIEGTNVRLEDHTAPHEADILRTAKDLLWDEVRKQRPNEGTAGRIDNSRELKKINFKKSSSSRSQFENNDVDRILRAALGDHEH